MSFRTLLKSISSSEWRFVFSVSLILIIITSTPHFYALLNTPQDSYYTGIQILNSADTRVYFSYIEQVKQGHFLFKNLFTSEPQRRIIFNPFWLGVGLVVRVFDLSSLFAFQLVRILLIPILFVILYLFLSYFFSDEAKRKLTFLLLGTASGVGALASPLFLKFYGQGPNNLFLPIDLWVPESNVFMTIYNAPHFIASLGLIVLIFLFILLAFEANRFKYSLVAGVLGLVLFLFHPFHVPLVFGFLGIYWLVLCFKYKKILWSYAKHCLVFLLLSLPAILYYLIILKQDEVSFWVTSQNNCLTPGIIMIIAGYGFLFILALLGIWVLIRFKKLKDDKYVFLISWFVFQFLLIYLPINFQRRFIEGLQIPIVIFTGIGLFFAYYKLKERPSSRFFRLFVDNKVFLLFLFVLLFFFTNIFIIAADIEFYSYGREVRSAYIGSAYISQDKLQAMDWFRDRVSEDNIILSSPANGNLIPAFSARKVYFGHGIATIFYKSKLMNTHWFFKNNIQDSQKEKFLKEKGINYIFYSPEEEKLGNFTPKEKAYLKEVYKGNRVSIYQVK